MALAVEVSPDLFEKQGIVDDASDTSSEAAQEEERVLMFDPSEHFRPEHKDAQEYRQYTLDQVSVYLFNCFTIIS